LHPRALTAIVPAPGFCRGTGTSHYLLGYLCWVFADMSWAMHKIAGALFATPPTCTYEKALQHFLDAENVRSVNQKDYASL